MGAMDRAPTYGLEHLALKGRGAIHCARPDEPEYLDKLIDSHRICEMMHLGIVFCACAA